MVCQSVSATCNPILGEGGRKREVKSQRFGDVIDRDGHLHFPLSGTVCFTFLGNESAVVVQSGSLKGDQ